MSRPYRVIFVCMGNICRSPSAHAVFRHKVQVAGLAARVHVSSAGTLGYHAGDPPDPRSQAHAARRGYDLSDLRARQLTSQDMVQADLVLCMDWDNLHTAQADCPPEHQHKLRRLTEFCQNLHSDVVPDPYAGGPQGFERVLDLVEDASEGLLAYVSQHVQRP